MTNRKGSKQFLLRLPEELEAKVNHTAFIANKSKTDIIIDAITAYTDAAKYNDNGILQNPQDVIASVRLNYASSINSAINNSLAGTSHTISNSVKSWQNSVNETSKYISAISDLGGETTSND